MNIEAIQTIDSRELEKRIQELVRTGVVSCEVSERPPLQHFEPIRVDRGPVSDTICQDRVDRF